MEKFHVFGQFVRKPAAVGAVAESSRALAELITEAADLRHASVVVEFGPGTGAFTEVILRKIGPDAVFFAIEANESFAAATRKRCPGAVVFHDSATSVRQHLEASGRQSCDCIVSGLPFASFTPALQDEILAAVVDVLKPGGRFVTFAHLGGAFWPRGRRFRRRLEAEFPDVTVTPTVWSNLPPAFVYRAIR
ncbi:MAG: methyltransferase domain-containing protein [Acidobacteria bacterium]|nr:methyltransferase domain-containing protein [Acidobacteriota bacterium]